MLEKITGVKIQGGRFTEWTLMEDILKCPFNILYGTNGSGKSTLAKALHDYGKSEDEKVDKSFYIEMLACEDNIDPEKFEIHVFNEDFINSNMRLTENRDQSSLNTIVMFGKQMEQNDKAEIIKRQIEHQKEDIEQQERVIRDNDTTDKRGELLTILRSDGDLADRVKNIKCQKNAIQKNIVAGFIDEIIGKKNEYGYSVNLLEAINNAIVKINNAKGQAKYTWMHDSSVQSPVSITDVNILLKKVVNRPVTNDREKMLIGMTEEMMTRTRDVMTHIPVYNTCPLCRQPINEDHRTKVVDAINAVLNKEVEEFTESLRMASDSIVEFKEYPFDLPGNYDTDIKEYKLAVVNANKELSIVKAAIERRINAPFSVVNAIDEPALNTAIDKLNAAIAKLEKNVEEFNNACDGIRTLTNEAIENAKELAYMEHRKEFDDIATMDIARKNAQEQVITNEAQIASLNQQLKDALAAQKNTNVAMDFINDCLSYVFADSSRMYLEADEGCYKVKVDGNDVDIRNVSTGERNIMALAYFFATLFADKNEEDKYRNEMLVAIDDPISSFDYNNKAGVMGLLREQVANIVKGNKNSKMLLITHDQLVATSMQTIYEQSILNDRLWHFEKRNPSNDEKKALTPDVLWLLNGEVSVMEAKSEYHEYLNMIYEFAKADQNDLDSYRNMQIGNTMRQVLENYANMMYNMPYTKLLTMGVLKGYLNIPDSKEKERVAKFFASSLSRFILNSSSHADGGITAPLRKQFAMSDLQPTARKILLLMQQTNEMHLKAFLGYRDWSTISGNLLHWKNEMMGK